MNKLIINYKGIDHEIQVREKDGYLNATQLCKVGGKLFADYSRLQTTKEYHEYLVLTIKPIVKLIEVKEGRYGGTWVYKEIAYHIASWISPAFMHQLITTYDRLTRGDLTLVDEVLHNSNETSIYIDFNTKEKKPNIGWLYFIQFKEGIESDLLCVKVGKSTKINQRLKSHINISFYGINELYICKVDELDHKEKELIEFCSEFCKRVSSERFLMDIKYVSCVIAKMKSMI